MANFGGSTQLLGETQMLREKLAAAEAEVERLRGVVRVAGHLYAVAEQEHDGDYIVPQEAVEALGAELEAKP